MDIQTLITTLQEALDQAKELAAPPAPVSPIYRAPAHREVRVKPAPLPLGPAGFTFKDPTYGSTIIRVTDQLTSAGSGCRVPSSEHLAAWNVDGSKFYVVNAGGGTIVFDFDGTKATKSSVVVPTTSGEPCFSFVDPAIIYTAYGPTNRIIKKFNLTLNSGSTLLNLDARFPNIALANTYIGAFQVVDNDTFVVAFGGAQQDLHRYLYHSKAGFKDVSASYHIHALSMDRTGRYVNIYPTSVDLARGVAQVQSWDTQTNVITPVTKLNGGHDCLGYGEWVNKDCCSGQMAWDALQWQYRKFADLSATVNLVTPVTPKAVFVDDHPNWRSASPDVKMPFITSTYRYGDGLDQTAFPWRPWDDEILAVATDETGIVSRFAHHQSVPGTEFWNQPIVNTRPDGSWAIFTSNWGNTVGANRQDVFLVNLW